MKFDLASDLHIDFNIDALYPLEPKSDVLVLAGDVVEIALLKGEVKAKVTKEEVILLFKKLSITYKQIFWVFGNHEFYNGAFNYALQNTRDILEKLGITNITILENETVEYDDTIIFGATLWTSMCNSDPLIMYQVQCAMNDYNCISVVHEKGFKRKLVGNDTVAKHAGTITALEEFIALKTDKKKLLITHHAPSMQSIPQEYIMNPYGYATEMFEMLVDSDIDVAVHGHVHEPVHYAIGNCLVVSNPRGYYGYETSAYKYEFKQVEV